MKSFKLGTAVFVLLLFAGCGDSAESLMKQQIADMNALADAMEAGKSEDDIKVISERMKAGGEKLNKMQISDAEKKRLIEKYEPQLKEASATPCHPSHKPTDIPTAPRTSS